MDTGIFISSFLSGIAILISVYSLIKTRQYLRYDYAMRLQVENESIEKYPLNKAIEIAEMLERDSEEYDANTAWKNEDPAFIYEAILTNVSDKPVDVAAIYLEYGSTTDESKRYKYVIEKNFHLGADDKHTISCNLTQGRVGIAMKEFSTTDFGFSLIVEFFSAQGNLIEDKRNFGSERMVVVQRGISLMPVKEKSWLNRLIN